MKKMKFTVLLLCGALLLGSCGTMNNKAKGGIIGGGFNPLFAKRLAFFV